MTPHPPIRPRELALAFAVIGLVGGLLTTAVFEIDLLTPHSYRPSSVDRNEFWLGWLLVLVTPLTAGLLGTRVAGTTRKPAVESLLLVCGAAALAGIVNGAVVGGLAGLGTGLLVGGILGVFFSIPFMPALCLVVLAARCVGRARAGSVLDRSDRRGVWMATGIAVALASAANATIWPALYVGHHHGLREKTTSAPLIGPLAVAALASLVVLLALDVLAFLRARRAAAETGSLVPAHSPSPDLASPGVVDFGMGEGASGVVVPASYRLPDRIRAIFVGDSRLVRDCLARSIAVATGGVALSALALWAAWRR